MPGHMQLDNSILANAFRDALDPQHARDEPDSGFLTSHADITAMPQTKVNKTRKVHAK